MKKIIATIMAMGVFLLGSMNASAYCPPHHFYNHTVVSGYTANYTHQYIYAYLEGGRIDWRDCEVTEYHDIWMYSCAECGAIYQDGGQFDQLRDTVHSVNHG